ncbi:PadR family transcriptional regulator [Enterococcus saigonensis]|uniref:PadR family transcriptional regulator n=1 Tax=Enterococcus saigonensis TaxID=1805431 RepID=A0A679ILS5_9ENTE|nr:PadR family transcriptional regulator [Enterococcus saigonensis]BCA86226.1 PadR family transcriptional regulator [Enterococcus saigonensis]
MDDALSDSVYAILLVLLKPQHGYAIMKEISNITNGHMEIGPASMYTNLKKLQKADYITLQENSDRKKVYQITSSGREALEKDIARRRLFYEAGIALLAKNKEELN